MFEVREIESDLTILLEVDYNDILEVILDNDPSLNTEVRRLADQIQQLREMIPELVWMPFKKLANRRDLADATLSDSDDEPNKPLTKVVP